MHRDISSLIHEYHDVFPEKLPNGLPPSRGKKFSIELITDARPQSRGIYRMPQPELEEVRKKLSELAEKSLIRSSSSPWRAPLLSAIKKHGFLRLCEDYRALNRLTVKNGYPFPLIDELLDSLREAKYFSKIDLIMGNHQIRLDKDAIPKTAFKAKYEAFELIVLPFSPTNVTGFFMSTMNEIFSDFIDKFFIVYLDDILIYIVRHG